MYRFKTVTLLHYHINKNLNKIKTGGERTGLQFEIAVKSKKLKEK
jgi:hypothetical protein